MQSYSSVLHEVLILAWYTLPVAAANMAPVVASRVFPWYTGVISAKYFGDHKTWRGIISAVLAGGIAYYFQSLLTDNAELTILPIWFGLILGLVAILGDLAKSYIKRLFFIKPGSAWFPFDQLDFVIPAFAVLYILLPLTIWPYIIGVVGALILHPLVNVIAYSTSLKDKPW